MTTKKKSSVTTAGASVSNVLNFPKPKKKASLCASCNAPARHQGEWHPFIDIPYAVLYALCDACCAAAAEGGQKGARVLSVIEAGLIERIPRLRETIETARRLGGVE